MRFWRWCVASLSRCTWLVSTLVLLLVLSRLHDFVVRPECMCFWEDTVRGVRAWQFDAAMLAMISWLAGEALWLTSSRPLIHRTGAMVLRYLPFVAFLYVNVLVDASIVERSL